jgi:alpha-1,2-mannosyltransferase
MRALLAHVRTGDWLTADRRRAYPLMLLALGLVVAVAWVAMADRLVDYRGEPVGTDFANVYAAGQLADSGNAAGAYDPAKQHEAEMAAFDGRPVPFYGWHYPPMFLTVAALLAFLPYGWALAAWMALTLPLYLAAIRAIIPRSETILVAAAFPAVLVNLGHGQNGFLTAALIGAALAILDRRPLLAGILIGLLAYKPQFGILIPLVLVATGRWQTFAAAAATVVATAALATLLFGTAIWPAFVASTAFTREVVLEAGGTGWQKIQSLFAAVRMWGGSVDLAYAAQGALFAALAASLVWLWRSAAAFELKAAALVTASLLATPYILDYDLVALAVAIAFLVRHGIARGFRDYEATALAFAWIAPLIARTVAGASGIPLGLLALVVIYGLTIWRAAGDLAPNRRESLARA